MDLIVENTELIIRNFHPQVLDNDNKNYFYLITINLNKFTLYSY